MKPTQKQPGPLKNVAVTRREVENFKKSATLPWGLQAVEVMDRLLTERDEALKEIEKMKSTLSYSGQVTALISEHERIKAERDEAIREVEQLRDALGEWKADFASVKTELSAEREASRKLVEAAKKMADQLSEQSDAGERYLTATEIEFRRALVPYFLAAPGHSPEGKAQ